MTSPHYPDAVRRHYTSGHLAERIVAGLRTSGCDLNRLQPEDLAPVDQLHVGGRGATRQLVQLAGIQPGWQVLDVGGGLGGAARLLARELRCQVTVLDLTPEFVETGAVFSERMDLAGLVHFRIGDALNMAFEDSRFDAAWTQHITMNIADKHGLYAEIHRVLRPGGCLAMHEIVAGPVQPPHYPTHWSADGSTSFLPPQPELRDLIEQAGFRELHWNDVSLAALEWCKRVAPVPGAPPAPLGPHLILSETAEAAARNQIRNLAEQRVQVVMGAFERR